VPEPPTKTRDPQIVKRIPRAGDFYTNGRELYEVLLVENGRAMMENCRTEFSTEFDFASVRKMRLVRGGNSGMA
jgi:hypothetical protein